MAATFTHRVHYRTAAQIAALTEALIEDVVLSEHSTKSASTDAGITVSYAAHLLRSAGCQRIWLTPAELTEIRTRRAHK
jgi:hypothetical protein